MRHSVRKHIFLSGLSSLAFSFGLLAAGEAYAQCTIVTDDPVNGCIAEVRIDSPQMSVTGQSASVAPGQAVEFTAQAFTGFSTTSNRVPTPCDRGWDWKVYNPLGGLIDPASIVTRGNTLSITAENNPGIGRIQATCRDNPSITDEVTVQASGALAPPPAPTPIGATPIAATPITATPITPTTITPTPVTPTAVTPTAAGSGSGVSPLLIGGAVIAGIALAGAIVSAVDEETSTTGGGDSCGVTLSECCSSGGVSVVYCAMPASCGCPTGTTQNSGDNIGNVYCWCP